MITNLVLDGASFRTNSIVEGWLGERVVGWKGGWVKGIVAVFLPQGTRGGESWLKLKNFYHECTGTLVAYVHYLAEAAKATAG